MTPAPYQPTPAQAPTNSTSDPAADFYFPNRAAEQQAVQASAPQGAHPPQPLQQQQQHQLHAQAPQAQAPQVHAHAPQAPAPQVQKQVYQQANATQPQQNWPQQHFSTAGYGPESFPTAPQHQPKVEEALIEL
jgi:growth factor-regulated tyrosine kinase substrate